MKHLLAALPFTQTGSVNCTLWSITTRPQQVDAQTNYCTIKKVNMFVKVLCRCDSVFTIYIANDNNGN